MPKMTPAKVQVEVDYPGALWVPVLIDIVRAAVRPAITMLLVGSVVAIAVLYALDRAPNAEAAVIIVSPLAALAMEWWFSERRRSNERNGG